LALKFLSVTPQTGSPAGSTIYASVLGIGTTTTNVAILANSASICATLTIPSSGLIKCVTNAATLAQTSLVVTVGPNPTVPVKQTV
jgi:hypothetical protein